MLEGCRVYKACLETVVGQKTISVRVRQNALPLTAREDNSLSRDKAQVYSTQRYLEVR